MNARRLCKVANDGSSIDRERIYEQHVRTCCQRGCFTDTLVVLTKKDVSSWQEFSAQNYLESQLRINCFKEFGDPSFLRADKFR